MFWTTKDTERTEKNERKKHRQIISYVNQVKLKSYKSGSHTLQNRIIVGAKYISPVSETPLNYLKTGKFKHYNS